MRSLGIALLATAAAALPSCNCDDPAPARTPGATTTAAEPPRFSLVIEPVPAIDDARTLGGGTIADSALWLWGGNHLRTSADGRAAVPDDSGTASPRRLDLAKPLWREVRAPKSRGPGQAPAVAAHATKRAVFSFGGWLLGAAAPHADLLRLDTAAGTMAVVEHAEPWPRARNGACAFVDEREGALWIFGGDGGPSQPDGFTPLADVWRFDIASARWKPIVPGGERPPARWHAMMAFDERSRTAYMLGGAGTGPLDERLWAFAVDEASWSVVATEGDAPPSLQGATLTFDAAARALVLVGGLRHRRPGPATSSDVWVLAVAQRRWVKLDGGPHLKRRDHVGAYDPAGGQHWFAGGQISERVGDFFAPGTPVPSVVSVRLATMP